MVFAILVALLVPGGIGAYIIYHGWQNMQDAEEARHWPSVEGRIVESRVAITHGSKGTTFYNPAFVYEYTVEGRIRRGDRQAFGTPTSGKLDEAESIVARTPVGTKTRVYYNPQIPGESVLDPTPQTGEYLIFFAAGAAFFIVPLFAILCGLAGS